jgi:hypothetical protein
VLETIRAMKKQLNSDSDEKCTTMQFHGNSYYPLNIFARLENSPNQLPHPFRKRILAK